MQNSYFEKKDGFVSMSCAQVIRDKSQDKDCHLCGNCHNAEPNLCAKVADVHKKNIKDYDFITEGYQSFDDQDESDAFIVENCKNFVPMVNLDKTKEKMAKYKKLKRQIACEYFDTTTPEEAYLLQVELFERGHLKINEDNLPSQKTIQLMRQRIRK